MQLKSLEIKGFKSFANETVIHFNEAVTGIVGPNGSGKSNVVDAIRWVLGEQKGRELRLEQMSDVIFNGTKKRREAPMAQVTLTFENTKNIIPTDYQTVAVSRILYRSGESEYRLNNVTCRLKDITGLFLDTGVGPDSYAIIALNMVEDLLSNKENARRKMFEQAAGISKYKTRKRESINKLKSTTEDLARIEDLLFEINNNLLELEKQAKRAKKFYEMRDKYRSAGLLLAHISMNNLVLTSAELDRKVEEEIIQLQAVEVQLRTEEAALEKFKIEHLDQEKFLGEHQRSVNELLDKLRNLESEIQVNQQRKSLFESQVVQLKSTCELLENRNEQYDREITTIQSDIVNVEEEIHISQAHFQALIDELQTVQSKYDELKTGVDKQASERQSTDQQIFENEKDLAIYSNQIENLNSEIRRAKEELVLRAGEFKDADSYLQRQDQNIAQVRTEISDLIAKEENRKIAVNQKKKEVDQQVGVVNSIERTKDAKQNEYDLLKAMIERMEGFPESMKYLNENWKRNVPVLSDVISVNDAVRSAVELYLEPYLNYYLVKNDKEALDAIQLLQIKSKGKANFFISDRFKTSSTGQSLNMPDATRALDLVECDPEYIPVLEYLLSNVYILPSTYNLSETHNLPENITVISANGTFLRQSKSLSGGSSGLFEGKRLGRRKHLEVLEKEIKSLGERHLVAEKELKVLRTDLGELEVISYDRILSELRLKESQMLQELTAFSTRFASHKELQNQYSERIEKNLQDIHNVREKIEAKSQRLSELKNIREQIQISLNESDQNFAMVTNQLSDISGRHNQANLELLKIRNRLDNLIKDKAFRLKQKEEVSSEFALSHDKITALTSEISTLSIELDVKQIELNTAYEERKEMQSSLTNLEQQYYEMRNHISISEQSIKDLQRNIYEMQSVINGLKEKRSDTQYKITALRERAELEFGTKFEDLKKDEETVDMTEEQLRDRVNYYKVRLDNYGEINPLAMEAYDEMKTRYDVIQTQREDILKAKESLLETIKEIEETATANFLDSFNKARGHFQTVFRSLFTEDDDCDLVLMDEMDPLECDIDIIAKPKGKRPKSISQLSGGEKTLTAIALLFSLYLLKPAPFCIFDEVDAPLDDINIEKFNKIVRQFSKESQFIIITHNKLTMAEVDVLYGVYMEEQGISNVTAVDFRKYDYDSILTEMQG